MTPRIPLHPRERAAAHRCRRVVLTGGPGAGKTVIARRVAELDAAHFAVVPEAATQVYDRLQTRWDKLDLAGRQDVQRQIYRLQVEQEQAAADRAANDGKTLLLDRGTIDGAAYWPGGAEDYWRDLGTTHDVEIARYDAVIWMESCAALGLYDGDASNACRFEDAGAAVESGKLLLRLWSGHPRVRHVGAFVSLEDKIAAVREMLAMELESGRG